MITEWETEYKPKEYVEFKHTVLAHEIPVKEWTVGYVQKLRFVYNQEQDRYECLIPREMMDEFNRIYFTEQE